MNDQAPPKSQMADQLVLAPRRRLEAKVAKQESETLRLKTYLKLLEYTKRRAQLEVISQTKDAAGGTLNTLLMRSTG